MSPIIISADSFDYICYIGSFGYCLVQWLHQTLMVHLILFGYIHGNDNIDNRKWFLKYKNRKMEQRRLLTDIHIYDISVAFQQVDLFLLAQYIIYIYCIGRWHRPCQRYKIR